MGARQAEIQAEVADLERQLSRQLLNLEAIGTQIVGLMMGRYVLEVQPLASPPLGQIATAVAPTLQHYLVGPLM